MPYTATWTDANAQGNLTPGKEYIRDDHSAEIITALNRRRRLGYLADVDLSDGFAPWLPVRYGYYFGVIALSPPRGNWHAPLMDILPPPAGTQGGQPPSPTSMAWLWPVAGADENKEIAFWPADGKVSLIRKINGTDNFSMDGPTGGTHAIRACHINEMRRAVEYLRRGRWMMPLYWTSGMFSTVPDEPWVGGYVANNGAAEICSVGCILARTESNPPLGLVNVTIRSASIQVTAGADIRVEVFRILQPAALLSDPPTWNRYRQSSASYAWAQPGGTGAADSVSLGTLTLTANQSGTLTGQALTGAIQAMIDGAGQNFLIRRLDNGYTSIPVSSQVTIEFDINSPPN